MTLPSFLEFIIDYILTDDSNSTYFTDEDKTQLYSLKSLCELITNNVSLTPNQLAQVFPLQSVIFNEVAIELLYLFITVSY